MEILDVVVVRREDEEEDYVEQPAARFSILFVSVIWRAAGTYMYIYTYCAKVISEYTIESLKERNKQILKQRFPSCRCKCDEGTPPKYDKITFGYSKKSLRTYSITLNTMSRHITSFHNCFK